MDHSSKASFRYFCSISVSGNLARSRRTESNTYLSYQCISSPCICIGSQPNAESSVHRPHERSPIISTTLLPQVPRPHHHPCSCDQLTHSACAPVTVRSPPRVQTQPGSALRHAGTQKPPRRRQGTNALTAAGSRTPVSDAC